MEVVTRIPDLRKALHGVRRSGKTIGLVPTMGALHAGHLALLSRARDENDVVAMSLFVNPTQFTEIEDYEKYPRDRERDFAQAGEAGIDYVFAPDMGEMYESGYDTVVAVRRLSDILEGESRPGHFQGVSTVVTKLLNIAGASRAYFGKKDYQQLQLIRRLVIDLNLPTEIVACETVRESDGLAMSSRNVRLTPQQRKAAAVLHKGLLYAQEIADTGVHDAHMLRAWMAQTIEVEPEAKLDYAVIVDPVDLRELDSIDHGAVALVAASFGKVRLIDNRVITPAPGLSSRT